MILSPHLLSYLAMFLCLLYSSSIRFPQLFSYLDHILFFYLFIYLFIFVQAVVSQFYISSLSLTTFLCLLYSSTILVSTASVHYTGKTDSTCFLQNCLHSNDSDVCQMCRIGSCIVLFLSSQLLLKYTS